MIAFFDCHNLCHKALHTTGNLEHGGNPTGVIFGFFNQVFTFYRVMGPGYIPIFCWDSKPYLRSHFYPKYKKRNSEYTQEQKDAYGVLYPQIDQLRDEILPRLGFMVWQRPGFEADDLIAFGVSKAKGLRYIVSGDEDLYQLLGEAVAIYKPGPNKPFTAGDFISKYGIDPDKWSDVKALAGCSGDNVEGVKKVGEATAIKYLNHRLKPSTKAWKSIKEAEANGIIKRNINLVKLPFLPFGGKFSFGWVEEWEEWWDENGFINDVALNNWPHLYKGNFLSVFEEFGFQSLIARMGEISKNFFLY